MIWVWFKWVPQGICNCLAFFIFNVFSFQAIAQTNRVSTIVQFQPSFDINTLLTTDRLNLNPYKSPLLIKNLNKNLNIYRLDYNILEDSATWIKQFNQNSIVATAQWNRPFSFRGITPNDSLYKRQINLHNPYVDQNYKYSIDVDSAWVLSKGGVTSSGDTIVIAVVDGGFGLGVTELDYYHNYGEIPNNGKDDDANGYIDDYTGFSFLNANGQITYDDHGTQVAGIAAAKTNNKTGTAGVAYRAKILPLQIDDALESQVIEAYGYIAEMRRLYNQSNGAKGAFIVVENSSFGIDNGLAQDYPIWCMMYDEMGKVGVLSAVSTANANTNVDIIGDIPSNCPSTYTIVTTNVDSMGKLDIQAAYGDRDVDIAAPGFRILAAAENDVYVADIGTSFAAPHVAGVIALMYGVTCGKLSELYKDNPAATGLLIKDAMLKGVNVDINPNLRVSSKGLLQASLSINTLLGTPALNACTNTSIALTDLTIYPNPLSRGNDLKLFVPKAPGKHTLQVTDARGRVIRDVEIQMTGDYISISSQDFAPGLYILKLSGSYKIQKLLVF